MKDIKKFLDDLKRPPYQLLAVPEEVRHIGDWRMVAWLPGSSGDQLPVVEIQALQNEYSRLPQMTVVRVNDGVLFRCPYSPKALKNDILSSEGFRSRFKLHFEVFLSIYKLPPSIINKVFLESNPGIYSSNLPTGAS